MPEQSGPITITQKRYQCRHIHADGRQCGSPALRREQFCYFHHPTRRPPCPAGRRPKPPGFHLPALLDRASIQRALAKVISRVASGRLDPRQARILLFGLKLANRNLPGDPRPLGALFTLAFLALADAPIDALSDVLRCIRRRPRRTKNPPSPSLTTSEPSLRQKHPGGRGTSPGSSVTQV